MEGDIWHFITQFKEERNRESTVTGMTVKRRLRDFPEQYIRSSAPGLRQKHLQEQAVDTEVQVELGKAQGRLDGRDVNHPELQVHPDLLHHHAGIQQVALRLLFRFLRVHSFTPSVTSNQRT